MKYRKTKSEKIQESINKWEVVKREISNCHQRLSYVKHYWKECGYCHTCGYKCKNCLLNDTIQYDDFLYYYCDSFSQSIAIKTLNYADEKEWNTAMMFICMLLKKMYKDLEWVKEGENNVQEYI